MKTLTLLLKYAIFSATLLIVSCGDEDSSIQFPESNLVTYQKTLTRTSGDLKTFMESTGLNLDLNTLLYDVTLYKTEYTTHIGNEEVTASGYVILPKTDDPVGMVSFQHGTIAAHHEAPTALPISDGSLIFYAALASAGFIATIPDYIGFGSSDSYLHPYYVEDLTAHAVADLLVAAKYVADENNVSFNSKLFLSGYSQGGYATMATHKLLETTPLSGFELQASFPAAGGYDVKGMQEYFFGLETYDQPFFLPYVAVAFKEYVNFSQPLDLLFQEPYVSEFDNLFTGELSGNEINEQLTDSISQLVQLDLLENIETKTEYQFIVDAFKNNSLTEDWYPTLPVYMYHGTSDVTVPYANSLDSYEKWIEMGADKSILSLTDLPDADHYTGVGPYIEIFMPILISMK